MKVSNYSEKYNEITKVMLENFTKGNEGKNLVFSPVSIITLLGMAADSVAGKAREEIAEFIGGGISFDDVMTVLKRMQKIFTEGGSVVSSNAVCVKKEIRETITESYESRLKEIFDGELFSSENIVNDVNEWARVKTKGMIDKVADESLKSMVACLINAVSFEAEWAEQYEEGKIFEDEFTNADGTKSEVQMMCSNEDRYVENAMFTGFVKPYKDRDYSFMAILPKGESVSFSEKNVKEIDFAKMFRESVPEMVDVMMPEFKYDFSKELTDICMESGIKTIFTPEADFSPMSSTWLKIDSIIHKAHIEVDRKGTKAAAVTGAFLCLGCAPHYEAKEVCIDRPFAYAIMNSKTGLPVFVGVCNHMEE